MPTGSKVLDTVHNQAFSIIAWLHYEFKTLFFPEERKEGKITMENGNPSQGEGKDPSGFLGEIIGNPVTVKLNSGVVYKGEPTEPRDSQSMASSRVDRDPHLTRSQP